MAGGEHNLHNYHYMQFTIWKIGIGHSVMHIDRYIVEI